MNPKKATLGQHAAAVACTLVMGLALHGVMSISGWSASSPAHADAMFNGESFETADDQFQFRHLK